MPSERHCPECHTALPFGTPEGFCPVCEFRGALTSSTDALDCKAKIDDAPGDTATFLRELGFFEDYELVKEIGRGGMGVVFKARQISLRRTVALKMIRSGPLASPAFVDRFKREAEAAARLDHPNIVPIYEVGRHRGMHFFTMKLVEGLQLGVYTLSNPRRAAEVVAKIARAVHYAHQRGVLHRDLKPGNILVDINGEPYVTDFGLAKLMEFETGLTMSEAMLGTPSYMAPEQTRGGSKELTTAADLYALGVILYELLTGAPPFTGATPTETLRKALDDEPIPPSRMLARRNDASVANSVDGDLDTICLKCLEKLPSERYSSAAGLADDLEAWLRHEPIQARASTVLVRMKKWVRRRPAIAGLAVTILALLILAAVGSSVALVQIASANREAERNLYVANMNLAQADWEAGNNGRVITLLEQTRNSLDRGFEWHFWDRRSHSDSFRIAAHAPRAYFVAFSSDGKQLLTGGGDLVKLWTVTNNSLILKVAGFTNEIWRGKFSPDGSYIGTSGETRRPEVWNTKTGTRVFALQSYDSALRFGLALAFAPDDRQFLWGTATGELEIRSLIDGKIIRVLPKQIGVAQVADWARDGRIVAGFRNGTVTMWNSDTGNKISSWTAHESYVTAIQFSPDQRKVATGGNDRTAKLWDGESGQELVALPGHVNWVSGIAFAPDGSKLVTSGGQSPSVWDTTTGQELFSLRGHSLTVWSVAYSPDGTTIATASLDGTVRLWNSAPPPDPLTLSNFELGLQNLTFLPDNRHLVFATTRRTIQIRDVSTGAVPLEFPVADGVRALSLSGDGTRIVTLSMLGVLQTWHVETGELVRSFQTDWRPKFPELEAFTQFAHCRATGQFAVATGRSVRVYSEKTGAELKTLSSSFSNSGGAISSLGYSPDGRLLAVGSEDGSILIWDLIGGVEHRTLQTTAGTEPKFGISAVTFSPDGKLLISCGGSVAEVWNVSSGRRINSLSGHSSWVANAIFSPDGGRIVTGGPDGTVRIWETQTGRELLKLPHANLAFGLAFSADGTRLAIGSSMPAVTTILEGAIKVWDASPR